MKADSIHGSIDQKMKKEEEIISFDELGNICLRSIIILGQII